MRPSPQERKMVPLLVLEKRGSTRRESLRIALLGPSVTRIASHSFPSPLRRRKKMTASSRSLRTTKREVAKPDVAVLAEAEAAEVASPAVAVRTESLDLSITSASLARIGQSLLRLPQSLRFPNQ